MKSKIILRVYADGSWEGDWRAAIQERESEEAEKMIARKLKRQIENYQKALKAAEIYKNAKKNETKENADNIIRFELYSRGFSDGEIAKILGLHINTIFTWRRKRKLSSNRRKCRKWKDRPDKYRGGIVIVNKKDYTIRDYISPGRLVAWAEWVPRKKEA